MTERSEKLLATLRSRSRWWRGTELVRATGLWPGTLYPLLHELEARGVIESASRGLAFPRARVYRLVRRAA